MVTTFLKKVLLVSLLFTFENIYSYPLNHLKWHVIRDGEQRNYSLLHLPNKKGTPIILTHALILNGYAVMNWAIYLWEHGYDVWLPHARGHGLNDEQTTVTPYRIGSYSVEKMVTEDAPYLIDKIFAFTKKKIILMGHSMGGLVWEKYLSGIESRDGLLVQSSQLAQLRAQKIHSLIILATPANYHKFNPKLKKIFLPFYSVFKKHHLRIRWKLQSTADQRLTWPKKPLNKFIQSVAKFLLSHWPLEGIISPERWNNDERLRRELMTTALSNPHTDYIFDFLRWIFEGYTSSNQEVKFFQNKECHVPTLYFVGKKDSLSNANEAIKNIRKNYPPLAPLKLVVMNDYSHIDFILKDALSDIGPLILQFIKNHEKIGRQHYPENGHLNYSHL